MNCRDYNKYADEELVKLSHEGDRRACDWLIKKYRNTAKMKSRNYYMTGSDRDDIVQEGMIGIFNAIRDFDPSRDVSFATFAGICIERQIKTAVTGANRKKNRVLSDSLSLNSEECEESRIGEMAAIGYGENPEEMLFCIEAAKRISDSGETGFSQLEEEIWQQVLCGKNCREIAEDTGKSLKTVDNAIQRIRKKLSILIESI